MLTTTVIHKFDTTEPKMALTIDDGPYSANTTDDITNKLLDTLAGRARATFFLIGWRITPLLREPVPPPLIPSIQLLQRFAAGFHEVCNHTYHHPPNYPFGGTCSVFIMPQLSPTGEYCSWELTILGFQSAVFRRNQQMANMFVNPIYWRSPHFAGTDPETSGQRSKLWGPTNQTMVNFIYDRTGRRPVTATAGFFIPPDVKLREAVRHMASHMRAKYLDPRGSIIIGHHSEPDRKKLDVFLEVAKRRSLTLTTVGEVADGAKGTI